MREKEWPTACIIRRKPAWSSVNYHWDT